MYSAHAPLRVLGVAEDGAITVAPDRERRAYVGDHLLPVRDNAGWVSCSRPIRPVRRRELIAAG